jgi:hypothetical protein
MLISVTCKACEFDFQVHARFAGKRGTCPNPECGRAYRVPAPANSSPANPSAAERETQTRTTARRWRVGGKIGAASLAGVVSLLMLIVAMGGKPDASPSGDGNRAADDKTAIDKPTGQQKKQPAKNDELAGVSFDSHVSPFLQKYCYACHGPQEMNEGVAFHIFKNEKSLFKSRKLFGKVISHLQLGAMPPEDHDAQPTKKETELVVRWLDRTLFDIDCNMVDDPGRVTIRRLNRSEYDNTIRDLLGVDFHPAKDFPSDDVGYGFDNIGDVLSLPPLLMEKYLDAAETISEAVVDAEAHRPKLVHIGASKLKMSTGVRYGGGDLVGLSSSGEVFQTFDFRADGQYTLRAEAAADQAGKELAKMQFRIDGKPIKTFEVLGRQRQVTTYETTVTVKKGSHRFAAAFINDYYMPKAKDPKDRDRNLHVGSLEIDGPKNGGAAQLSAAHKRLIFVRPSAKVTVRQASEQILHRFITRSFRRPVTKAELEQFVKLVEFVVKQGDSFERGIQVAVQGTLVSPHFLFRVENDTKPHDPNAKHTVGDYELASRLSYFLWSTMPDEELLELAGKGALHRRDVLEKQTRRMLKDPRSRALVDNFASQWLNLRRFDNATPDSKQFPMFTPELQADMRTETEMFFEAVMREDRSTLDFLVGEFTFVNERLAKHYGLTDITGNNFRKVSLVGKRRVGVLTQGSILTLTSNPERTSPVKRGKWILQNILGTPPPDPPDGVPELEDPKPGEARTVSLRKQLEIHRRDPGCASCHDTMDQLGFGFENFDPIGRWREKDAQILIDSSGVLPTGEKFSSAIELVRILSKRKRDFSRSLSKKMLTYALGRGLDFYDKCAVDDIINGLERNDARFSTLILEIVNSKPFLMRRGDAGAEE